MMGRCLPFGHIKMPGLWSLSGALEQWYPTRARSKVGFNVISFGLGLDPRSLRMGEPLYLSGRMCASKRICAGHTIAVGSKLHVGAVGPSKSPCKNMTRIFLILCILRVESGVCGGQRQTLSTTSHASLRPAVPRRSITIASTVSSINQQVARRETFGVHDA